MRALLICVAAGCGVSSPDVTSSEAFFVPQADDCEHIGCPGNGPLLGAIGPYELSMGGTPSSRGFTFDPNNITWRLIGGVKTLTNFEVIDATLHATHPVYGALSGPDMVTAEIPVHYERDGVTFDYLLKLEKWHPVAYYDGGDMPRLDTYYIRYADIDGPTDASGMPLWQDLCPYVERDPESKIDGHTWAMFWKGDRYNPVTGKVFAGGAAVGDWFNIGCAGDSSTKMVRARASHVSNPGVPWQLQDATLNMFTAKFCPDRLDRYTHLGVNITWEDKLEVKPMGVATIEAIWNEKGAFCKRSLRTHDEGEPACRIPECTDDQIEHWKANGHLISGMPLVALPKPKLLPPP